MCVGYEYKSHFREGGSKIWGEGGSRVNDRKKWKEGSNVFVLNESKEYE